MVIDVVDHQHRHATGAAHVADERVDSVRFAVVDVETSGLSARRHRLLQVAVVVVDGGGAVLDRWGSFVRPRVPWLHRVGPRHIHGIGRAAVARAPRANVVLSQLAQRADGCVVVAHNAAFDMAFLRRAYDRAGIPFTPAPLLCTLELSRQLDPERALSHRLVDVCARYGVSVARAHDALADAEATAALVPHLLRAHRIDSAASLSPFLVS